MSEMAVIPATSLRDRVAERLVDRNAASRALFTRESSRLAAVCDEMAQRFLAGGRLIAFGRGASATDAQHVSVEFVHPVIVGKRALPALDVSAAFTCWLPSLVRETDVVMGFAAPEGDDLVARTLGDAQHSGALTFALSGRQADFPLDPPSTDPFIAQELVEILYHTLWETVHVFLEHRERGHENVGASAFLYPFLGGGEQDLAAVTRLVASSIQAKAADDERLRIRVAHERVDEIAEATAAIHRRITNGATLVLFGNGGSATDANDWAIDCATSGIPALSLSLEPANVTAIANDIGTDAIFLRQLIAHGGRGDVAVAISTSGGSPNVIAALEEARKRQMLTVALLGYDGGEILRRGLADLPIVVPCDYIPRIQEVQASIYHVMTECWKPWRV
jgi:D-sedoheptulose 7-phosphate isomerase